MTSLETFIPVKLLLTMFVTGIDSMNRLKLEKMTTLKVGGEPDVAENSGEAAYVGVETDDDLDNIPNLKCFVQMLDLIFKQVRRRKFNYVLWFSNSDVSSVICSWLTTGRASGHRKLTSINTHG